MKKYSVLIFAFLVLGCNKKVEKESCTSETATKKEKKFEYVSNVRNGSFDGKHVS